MENPEKKLLVIGTACGDLKASVIGYYHYDKSVGKHCIALEKSLLLKEVYPDTITLLHSQEI